jgi:hypothetical protein
LKSYFSGQIFGESWPIEEMGENQEKIKCGAFFKRKALVSV